MDMVNLPDPSVAFENHGFHSLAVHGLASIGAINLRLRDHRSDIAILENVSVFEIE